MIAITCNLNTDQLGRRIQMWIDHHALFKPITKASFRLEKGKIAETVKEAIRLASDVKYGLAGYVWGGDPERARQLESLRLARTEMTRQLEVATHDARKQQLGELFEPHARSIKSAAPYGLSSAGSCSGRSRRARRPTAIQDHRRSG